MFRSQGRLSRAIGGRAFTLVPLVENAAVSFLQGWETSVVRDPSTWFTRRISIGSGIHPVVLSLLPVFREYIYICIYICMYIYIYVCPRFRVEHAASYKVIFHPIQVY